MREPYRRHLIAGERAAARYVLAPPRATPAGRVGFEPIRCAGSSLEFEEHRDYAPGDDLRRIDWSAFARTDRLVVKDFREEATPHLDLILDGSRSMALDESKAEAALGLAALLAAAAGSAGYSHTAWLAASRCEPVSNGSRGPALWEGIDFDYGGSPFASLATAPPAWRRRGVRILVSDLLWPEDPLRLLARLADGAASVGVVMLLASADASPDARGSVRLVDVESGARHEAFLDAASLARYRQTLVRHQESWSRAAKQVGAAVATLISDQVVPDFRVEALASAGILDVV